MKVQASNVGVVIPAFNEEERIAVTLRTLKRIPAIDDILVVDDGSRDNTSDIVTKEGVKLLRLGKNFGKGYALKKGIEMLDNTIIVFLDADIGESAIEVLKLITPIMQNTADVTIAKFPSTPGKGGFGLVKGLSGLALHLLTGRKCESVLSGQRAFRKSVMRPEFLKYKGFGIEFGMTVDLIRQNARIMEVEVNMHHRTTGKDWYGFRHRARQFIDICYVIIKKQISITRA